jgi:hypothetical protein
MPRRKLEAVGAGDYESGEREDNLYVCLEVPKSPSFPHRHPKPRGQDEARVARLMMDKVYSFHQVQKHLPLPSVMSNS